LGDAARDSSGGENLAVYPVWVWDPRTCRIELADDETAELFGEPVCTLVGSDLREFVQPLEEAGSADAPLASESVHGLVIQRDLVRRSGVRSTVTVWTRTIRFDGSSVCASLGVPGVEGRGLASDPGRPWRQLVDVAVGTMDAWCRVERLSEDVSAILGLPSVELIGKSLMDLVHPDDAERVSVLVTKSPLHPQSIRGIRFLHASDSWSKCALLVAPRADGTDSARFTVVGPSGGNPSLDRVTELEARLLRIAKEISAAGISSGGADQNAQLEFPELELTTRQWEILSRMLEGARVSTIAAELLISESTVRNHLSTIFQRFGVHSQSDLIEKFRQPRSS
jgi:DNA-binding CsgD family transcriptional regulator/PAS domain-containing protein